MNKTQKILGVLAIGIVGYWLYMKSKKPTTTTETSTTTTQPQEETKGCPQGTQEIVLNCFKAPCPKGCADKDGNLVTT